MPVHADLRERAALATDAMVWTARGALFEKVLEDDGRGHRTRLVYAPAGAAIPLFDSGCVDALVLDGEAAGMYVHRPAERELVAATACTMFVKERPSRDLVRVAIDIRSVAFEPHSPGLTTAELCEDDGGHVVLLLFAPGTAIGRHTHKLGEEFFVLSGAVTDELGVYAEGAWVRQPPGSVHSIASRDGCLFLTFADHLAPG